MKRLSLLPLSLAAAAAFAAEPVVRVNNPSSAERFAKPSDTLTAREDIYWKRTPLPIPDNVVLEGSGIVPVAGQRLLVTTRRGEIWWVDGAYAANPKPKFTLFASGLHALLVLRGPIGGLLATYERQKIFRKFGHTLALIFRNPHLPRPLRILRRVHV